MWRSRNPESTTARARAVTPKHRHRYPDGFVFRFDRRWRETEIFILVLHCAVDSFQCRHQQLTAERIG